MASPTEHQPPFRHPLIAIGAVVMLMLSIPLFLYPVVPDDTVKPGHVVFSSAKQTVHFMTPGKYQLYGFRNSCVLEANAPLVVVEPAPAQSEGAMVVKAKGEASEVEFPFCPPQAEVLVQAHQIVKKQRLFVLIKTFLASLLPS